MEGRKQPMNVPQHRLRRDGHVAGKRATFCRGEASTMTETYSSFLVGVSLVVAVLSSYTLLDVAARAQRVRGSHLARRCWLLGGAAVIGSGIWSTHFLGLLAGRWTMEMRYDEVLTALSLLIAVVVMYGALRLATEQEASHAKLGGGALLMGVSLTAMHSIGTMAMRINPGVRYSTRTLMGTLVVAVGASWIALWLMYALREGTWEAQKRKRGVAALVMGMGVAGMNYAGMSLAHLAPGAMLPDKAGIGTPVLGTLVTVFSLGGLAVAIALEMLGDRMNGLLSPDGFSFEDNGNKLNATNGLDLVTGLASRAAFLAGLEEKIAEARAGDTMLGLVFVDLDGFKTINDSLGYTSGDAVLRAFSDDLQRRTRANTVVGRLGGDEFALVLDGFDDVEKVQPMARSILDRMTTEFEVDGATLRVTSSVGIALYPRDGESVDALLKSASVAMHHAKQGGKNSFQIFDPAMSETASRASQITRGLGEALANNQFSLVFQPKYNGQGNRITGAEALLRWTHPLLGNVSPMDFIPQAEETGQIVPIGEWVIREVCRQLVAWKDMGLDPVKVAINLSPEQLRLEGYAARIYAIVRSADVDPRWIMFEITETAAMCEPKLAMAAIAEFQRAGFDFAIDDFGTGYSSMAYLQQFRVKELKIDRFFIGSLEDGAEAHTIVAAIIALAHALHMTVVAEGVETPLQLKQLNGMNCDEVQGYLLGRPLTPRDFEKLLRGEVERDELSEVAGWQEGQKPKPRLVSAIA